MRVSRDTSPDLDVPARIRFSIVSNVRLVREGLTHALRRRSNVVLLDILDFSADAIGRLAVEQPEVIAIDLSNSQGLAVARRLRTQAPASKLIAFAIAEVEQQVLDCAAAGFSGYVTREADADELLRAAIDAHNGRLICAPHIAAAMFDQLSRMPKQTGLGEWAFVLTAREQEVLALSDKGCSNKEIARELRISPSTVKNHIHNILQKLNVERRSQAAARVRENRCS